MTWVVKDGKNYLASMSPVGTGEWWLIWSVHQRHAGRFTRDEAVTKARAVGLQARVVRLKRKARDD